MTDSTAPVPPGTDPAVFRHGFSAHWMDVDRDPPERFVDLIAAAIDTGYRRIDCNPGWDTDAMVGAAIRSSGVSRDELFVTTVVPYPELGREGVSTSITSSLERLGLDRLDLILISAPRSGWDVPGTVTALTDLIADGRVRHVGARYMSPADLDAFMGRLDTPLFAHMTELHPLWHADELRRHAVEYGYWILADGPLIQGMVREVSEIRQIAARTGATPWQIALAWLHQLPNVATSTWTHDHIQMEENLAARELTLDPADVAVVDQIDRRWSSVPHLHQLGHS